MTKEKLLHLVGKIEEAINEDFLLIARNRAKDLLEELNMEAISIITRLKGSETTE